MRADPVGPVVRLVLQSDAGSVRAALQELFDGGRLGQISATRREVAELVLAEVLNNIVEHAQAGPEGSIDLTVRRTPWGLACTVIDPGRRMPGNEAPAGRLPDLSKTSDLPEGGFGWHLIRLLASNLAYRRIGDHNELSFHLPTEQ